MSGKRSPGRAAKGLQREGNGNSAISRLVTELVFAKRTGSIPHPRTHRLCPSGPVSRTSPQKNQRSKRVVWLPAAVRETRPLPLTPALIPLVWQFITEGYAAHLAQLEYNHRSRPAKNTTRMALRKGSFGLPSQTEFLRKRNHLLRTISSQPSASSGGAGHRPERTQSQSDSDKERDRERSQRSMSIATGCWGRSAASRLESGLLGQK